MKSSPKILKYFNGTVISAFLIPELLVLFNNLDLGLNRYDLNLPEGFLASLCIMDGNFPVFEKSPLYHIINLRVIYFSYTGGKQHSNI